jgi:hypothetical protein
MFSLIFANKSREKAHQRFRALMKQLMKTTVPFWSLSWHSTTWPLFVMQVWLERALSSPDAFTEAAAKW